MTISLIRNLVMTSCLLVSLHTAQAQSAAKAYAPSAADLPKLDKEEVALGFGYRMPRGYEAQPIKAPMEGATAVAYTGTPRQDKSRPTILILFLDPPDNVKKNATPEHLINLTIAQLKERYTDIHFSDQETGSTPGLTFYHRSWSGVHNIEKRAVRGGFYIAKDNDLLVQLTYQDVMPGADETVGLMESALKSFRKVSQLRFYSVQSGAHAQIYSMKPDGSDRKCITPKTESDYHPAISPDGETIAFTTHRTGTRSIWLMNPDGSNQRPLTDKLDAGLCCWSPNGEYLAFSSNRSGKYCIYRIKKDGSDVTKMTDGRSDDMPCFATDGSIIYEGMENGIWRILHVSPDGKPLKPITDGKTHCRWPFSAAEYVLFSEYLPNSHDRCHVCLIKMDGSMKTLLTDGDNNEQFPTSTSDFTQILFHSDRSKDHKFKMYVMESDKLEPRLIPGDDSTPAATMEITTAGRAFFPAAGKP